MNEKYDHRAPVTICPDGQIAHSIIRPLQTKYFPRLPFHHMHARVNQITLIPWRSRRLNRKKLQIRGRPLVGRAALFSLTNVPTQSIYHRRVIESYTSLSNIRT